MIELLFSDSATYTLMCAKQSGNGKCLGGTAVKLTIDKDGNETREQYEPEPYTGVMIEGSPEDVAGIWLVGNVGNISDLNNWQTRIESVNSLFDVYDDDRFENDWTEKAARQAEALVNRIKQAARDGEKVRIWWSDSAPDVCGFYWAMTFLLNANANVTAIKIPQFILKSSAITELADTGALEPEMFAELLPLEQPIFLIEREHYARLWNKLVSENAPLRAVINGKLCSVDEQFYDYFLKKSIPNGPVRIGYVIGTALANGPRGINDWWYANRLRRMIATGEIIMIDRKKPFYGSLIEKAKINHL